MNKKSGMILTLVLCLTACATPPAQTASATNATSSSVDTNYADVYARDSATGGFVHLNSQFTLPPDIVGWHYFSGPGRTNPAAAFAVAYEKGPSLLTVFIKDSEQAMIEGIRTSLVMRQNMTGERRVQLGVVRPDNSEPNRDARCFYTILTPVESASQHELLMTCPLGKSVLKLRISANGMTSEEAQKELGQVSEALLKWKPVFVPGLDKIDAR